MNQLVLVDFPNSEGNQSNIQSYLKIAKHNDSVINRLDSIVLFKMLLLEAAAAAAVDWWNSTLATSTTQQVHSSAYHELRKSVNENRC